MTKTEVETEYQKAIQEGRACRAVALLQDYYFLTPPPTLQLMALFAAAWREARGVV